VKVPECTLHANIPALSEVPHGWNVSLADNPGFGEANEHVAQLANMSVQGSSAYVYVTNSNYIGSDTNFKFFKQLAEHDQGTLTRVIYTSSNILISNLSVSKAAEFSH